MGGDTIARDVKIENVSQRLTSAVSSWLEKMRHRSATDGLSNRQNGDFAYDDSSNYLALIVCYY